MHIFVFLLFICLSSFASRPAFSEMPESTEVDLQLVLAADMSGSVTPAEVRAQRRGFAAAFRSPSVRRAIASGPSGRIAVVYFEWAGRNQQQVVIPWTVLSGPQDTERFAEALERSERIRSGGETSISGALIFARVLLDESGIRSWRKIVDVAGNGRNSDGPPVASALEQLTRIGTTVNALILPRDLGAEGPYDTLFGGYAGPLHNYYRQEVIGGPGAFAIEADPRRDFMDAILRKLVLEIAQADRPGLGWN